jgi:ATP-dependent DNA helicase RecQ
MNKQLEILNNYWGFTEFRSPQDEIISNVLSGNDTVALLPTGGGKSICFQIPAMLTDGLCIVISPLIALMNDQVKALRNKNIKAVAITSKTSENELINTFDNLKFGNYNFIYLSPEKLQNSLIQEKIKQLNIQLIAVDEAHCISEWGHDFRPAYLQINILRDIFPEAPFIALTASATNKVLTDIVSNLNLKNPTIFKKSFYRENLAYHIYNIEDKLSKIEQILKKTKGTKIIYTNTRRKTVEISNQLNLLGFNTCFYHGGMSFDHKIKVFESWMSESKPIIIATNAFGMGIDKANVRVVIHYDFPKSIENYIQEAGRAGRDGKKAFSVILKNKSDILTTQKMFIETIPSVEFIKKVYFQLNQYFQISYGELIDKSFVFDITNFCRVYDFPLMTTYNGIKTLEKDGILLLDEQLNRKSTAKFITKNNYIYDYLRRYPRHDKLIKLMLRTYGGIFEDTKTININYLCSTLNLYKSQLLKQLETLHEDKIIEFYNSNSSAQITFLVPREDNRTINIYAKEIEQRNTLKIRKLNALVTFIENDTICRSIQLLTYFDEKNIEDCGICDVCISKKKDNYNNISQDIKNAISNELRSNGDLSSKELVILLNFEEVAIINCLQLLLEKNRISVTSQNKYRLTIS